LAEIGRKRKDLTTKDTKRHEGNEKNSSFVSVVSACPALLSRGIVVKSFYLRVTSWVFVYACPAVLFRGIVVKIFYPVNSLNLCTINEIPITSSAANSIHFQK
jgi:SNF family Na+-dependent transporter